MTSVGRRSRGIALLLVIMVMTLMTVIVFAFAESSSIAMLVARNNMDEMKARTAIASAVQYAAVMLKLDRIQSEYDSLDEQWAQEFELELGDVLATVQIVDEASKFNMNRFLTARDEPQPAMIELWETAVFAAGLPGDTVDRMLILLEKRADTPLEDLEEEEPEELADEEEGQLPDEADAGDEVFLNEYAQMKVPVRPSELELLLFGEQADEDSPEQVFCRQITTVSRGHINLNTVSEALLDYIFTGDDPAIVETIVAEREIEPFAMAEDMARVSGIVGTGKARMFTVRSTVFAVNVEARVGPTVKRALCILKRFKSGQCIPIYYKDDIPAL